MKRDYYLYLQMINGNQQLIEGEEALTAYNQYKAGQTLRYNGLDFYNNPAVIYIPFHAIESVGFQAWPSDSAAPQDANCEEVVNLCDHETISVWPRYWESPFQWWEEGLTLGGAPYDASTFIGFSDDGTINDFTFELSNPDVVNCAIEDDGYGNNKLTIAAVANGETVITVSFPNYGCSILLNVSVEGMG